MYELNLTQIKNIAGGNLEAAEDQSSELVGFTPAQKSALLCVFTSLFFGTFIPKDTVSQKIAFFLTNASTAALATFVGNNFINN